MARLLGRGAEAFRLLRALLPVLVLGACSSDPGRGVATFAIPNATAVPIRMNVCKPGTFIGTMTVDCPQVAK